MASKETTAGTDTAEAKPPVPEPERNPSWYRPVFVLAPARSNSSVVSAMVGMHPELYGFPELCLWRSATVQHLLQDRADGRGLPAQVRTAGLARALAEVFRGAQDHGSVAWARDWLKQRSDWGVASVFDQLQGRVFPLVALEKSPENSNRQDYLERLDAAYPRARFLHVTRHPVTTVKSMYEAWKDAGFWDLPDDMFHMHLLGTWLFHHGRIKTFTEALPPDRWMRVRSEDILNAPDVMLPKICRWLGVESSDASIEAMKHPEKSPYARLGPRNALGGNDPKFLRDPAPRPVLVPTSLELPAAWKVDPWTHVAVVEFAAYLGYRHESG